MTLEADLFEMLLKTKEGRLTLSDKKWGQSVSGLLSAVTYFISILLCDKIRPYIVFFFMCSVISSNPKSQ